MAINSLHPVIFVQLPLWAIVSYLKYHHTSTTCAQPKIIAIPLNTATFGTKLPFLITLFCRCWGFFLACLFYRIEYFSSEGPTIITCSNCQTNSGLTKLKHVLRAMSKHLWSTDRLGALTTSLGCLFQCLNKCFPVLSLNLPWSNFEPFPHIPSLDARQKSSAPPSPLPFLRKL